MPRQLSRPVSSNWSVHGVCWSGFDEPALRGGGGRAWWVAFAECHGVNSPTTERRAGKGYNMSAPHRQQRGTFGLHLALEKSCHLSGCFGLKLGILSIRTASLS